MEHGSTEKTTMTYPGANAVHRALAVLKAFTDERPAWTLTAVAQHLNLRKPTAHRLLGVLEQEGFLIRDYGGTQYRLGPEVIVLGARALRAVDLRSLAHGELASLAQATGEGATLEVLSGHEVLILDEVRGRNRLGFDGEVGTRWPAHASATGKVLLAFLEDPTSLDALALDPVTPNTIVTHEALAEALGEVRLRGYATNREELELGYASVAAPVRDREGRAIAAISIGGSVHRVTEEAIPPLADTVSRATLRISRRLGFGGDG
jgi:DNA-binding IclR family transcriptional regulator